MNELSLNFEGHAVRVIDRGGEPWWVAKDVCDALGIKDASDAVKGLDDDEKAGSPVNSGRTQGGNPNALIINESGLYSLILRSRKPEAKRFKRWVTHEVLPAIRKTGSYAMPQATPNVPATVDRATLAAVVDDAVKSILQRMGPDLIASIRMPQPGEAIPEGLRVYVAEWCKGQLLVEGYWPLPRGVYRRFLENVRDIIKHMQSNASRHMLADVADPVHKSAGGHFDMYYIHRDALPQLHEAFRRATAVTKGVVKADPGQQFIPGLAP